MENFFLPAVGRRQYEAGALDTSQDIRAVYWSSLEASTSYGFSLEAQIGHSDPATVHIQSHGLTVRCVREIKEELPSVSSQARLKIK